MIRTVASSARFYFWPIISFNMAAMAFAIDTDVVRALKYSIVLACLSSFGFLINDLWDRGIDLINQAGHFEHSDRGTFRSGIIACFLFLLVGLSLALILGSSEFILSASIALGLIAYTVLLRRILLLPTILASVLATSPMWSPLLIWAQDGHTGKWTFVISTILIIAGREVLMDTRDRDGDLSGGRETFATVFGPRISKFVGLLITVTACLPFSLVVVSVAARQSPFVLVPAVAVLSVILFLLIESTIRVAVWTPAEERYLIQRYVLRSRVAMVLAPVLVILLWCS